MIGGGQEFESVGLERKPELAYDQLRRMLESGASKPGEKLPSEADLAGRFGASRTALREALKVLELSGYPEARREYGTEPSYPQAVARGVQDDCDGGDVVSHRNARSAS